MKTILKRTVLFLLLCTLMGSVTVHAQFVPSIEQKGAPEIMAAADANGADITSWIVVTPHSKRATLDSGKQENFAESFRKADPDRFYELLRSEYNTSGSTGPMNANLPSLPVDDASQLVVSDLFYVHEFEDRGLIEHNVEVTLTTNLPAHAFTAVFEYVDGQWQQVPVVFHGDGTMTLTVRQWGPFAIVTNVKQENSAVSSPQTGAMNTAPLTVLAAAGVILLALKKRNAA